MTGDMHLLQQSQAFLARLSRQDSRLLGAFLVSADGLLVAHQLSASDHIDRIAAMAAALHALGKEIGVALVLGEYSVLHVRLRNGEVYLIGAGSYTLAIISQAELEPAFLEAVSRQAGSQFSRGIEA